MAATCLVSAPRRRRRLATATVRRRIDGCDAAGHSLDDITAQLWRLSRHKRPKLILFERERAVSRALFATPCPRLPAPATTASAARSAAGGDDVLSKLQSVLKVNGASN